MFCPQCGKEIGEGAFCPYCGTRMPAGAASQAQQAQEQQTAYNPYGAYGAYGVPYGVPEADVKTTKTLGLVALIVGIFVPLVGYICGGIGISKVNKLRNNATEEQQERLAKNKRLCIAGIIVPIVLTILGIIISIFSFIAIAKRAKEAYDYYSDERNYSYSEDDARQFQDNLEDYLKQYGIEVPKE